MYWFTPATHAIQHLIDVRADVRSTVIQGYWKDTGNVEDMLEVNRRTLETSDSCVGPFTSIAENCRVTGVTSAPSVPSAHRLVLGDHSKVQIHS
ncbi:dTDP-glucose pyrophosphorylase [Streptomyces sp. V4I2]|nr:dTDP-glucose pyrophosphorylase [Streptomyces sp. V4I2]